MRVAFNKPNEELPLYCDSIGYHWPQPPIQRSNGYYAYHWLQTETGTGIVTINHQRMVLGPKQGVLFRPRIAHDYHPKDGHNWQTAFLSFNGTLCDQLADFLNLKDFIYIDRVSPELASFISESFNDFNSSNVAAMLDQSVELYKFMVLLRQNKLLKNRHYQDQLIAMPIISYISKHYAETISNEQLAKITKYSITY
ncbi:AraC family ligand binding domain-containing protein [Lentilactobacillus kisonensis]|uniref:AraC-like ligand binding domain protein n=1 Tax=Lentilactobacillus kisonensis F0435 TaxID=797516 RepID=H1LCD6_9LACO|nr:AraC family ligand binding domain-containing protein [Lentilactobacillus kisonensis]EHO54081.1 AraC-like ligand binding domain protein [Lentilactobacillus kisonensis F0435]